MSVNQTIKGLPTTEMFFCEACKNYHPIDDCEVVIIRMIKGKNCSMGKPVENFTRDLPVPEAQIIPVVKKVVDNIPLKVDDDGVGYHIPPKEMEKINAQRKSIIPPGLASMMVGPDDPNFETKGAKEVRRV